MRMMHNIISINGMSIYIMGLNRKAKEDNYCSQFNSHVCKFKIEVQFSGRGKDKI